MRFGLVVVAAAVFLSACAQMSAGDDGHDPLVWLEDVHGDKALGWVKQENARSEARFAADTRYETYRREALAILTAKDRIASPTFRGDGIDNLWQDDAHPHGVLRHTSVSSYRSGRPEWTTVLDLDALSKAEGRNWFLKDFKCLAPDDRLCLAELSDGGGDAVEIREFDAETKTFVAGGFHLDRAKQDVEWIDRDTLIVARAWSPGDATESGYPSVLTYVKRGTNEHTEVFRGETKDVGVGATVLRDADGAVKAQIARRTVGFFDREFYLLGGAKPVRLPLPSKSNIRGFVGGRMIVSLQEDWGKFKSGSLIAVEPSVAGVSAAELVIKPTARQTIDAVETTRDHVIVQMLDNVKGAVEVFSRGSGTWRGKRLKLPANSALHLPAAQRSGSLIFVTSESFLNPTRLWWGDAATGKVGQLTALPAKFNASGHVVEQHWATSKDGTKVPYFLVRPKAMRKNGSTPTLLFGYGGFQISKPPAYMPEMGKLWLERGGAFVTANIRGGGEFGPAWHQSALREHRQRSFDDFVAVAQDLIARKVTSPRRLGIYGRSNGGVLTSVSMTQHPELFNAVIVESPLVDMLRYHKLSAGASWTGEYGNPDVPGDRAFIGAYSAYQQLRPGVKYPEAYITTNTEDDRVHPGHARKFAAKLAALNGPYIYYENTFGGHSNDADPTMNAQRWARHYVYLAEKLMD